jgi:DDE superfamily endonuclease
MEILKQALGKIKSIGKNKYNFLILLVQGFIGVMGKRTFRNLSRYIGVEEHTISRQMAKKVDFAAINIEMIISCREEGDIYALAQDGSFIPKSGEKSAGVDYHWNGTAGRSEKGQEVDGIAVIRIRNGKKEGFAVSGKLSPANPIPFKERKKKGKDDPTKIDAALEHLAEVAPKLSQLNIKHDAVDAFYAKAKYVNGSVKIGLHAISKLRKDARLFKPYTGPQKTRGRKRIYDKERIKPADFKDSIVTTDDKDEPIELRSCIAYSPSMKRMIKVVLVQKMVGDRCGETLLFSTDLTQDTLQIYQLYAARFQIEFVFRDSKGFAGLTDCQSRDEHRINYHLNVSLLALNVAKLEDGVLQKRMGLSHAFSMTNWMRKFHVEIIINRFISMFGLDLTLIKLNPLYDAMLSFGNILH